jgi:hypothetical protein
MPLQLPKKPLLAFGLWLLAKTPVREISFFPLYEED